MVFRRSAFNQVGRDGEGCAGETDECLGVAELFAGDGDRFGNGVEVAGLQFRKVTHGGFVANWLGYDGSASGDDIDIYPGCFERYNNVGEEDCGVDIVSAHWLQGDFSGYLGIEAGVEHANVFSDLAILWQRPARLAHKPYRPSVGCGAVNGLQERGVG